MFSWLELSKSVYYRLSVYEIYKQYLPSNLLCILNCRLSWISIHQVFIFFYNRSHSHTSEYAKLLSFSEIFDWHYEFKSFFVVAIFTCVKKIIHILAVFIVQIGIPYHYMLYILWISEAYTGFRHTLHIHACMHNTIK